MCHVCGSICYLCVELKLMINTRSLYNQALKSAHPSLLSSRCWPWGVFIGAGQPLQHGEVRDTNLAWVRPVHKMIPAKIHVFWPGSLSWTLQWSTVRCRRRGKTRVQQITWHTNPRCRCWDGHDGTAGEITWPGKYFTISLLLLFQVKVYRLFDAEPETLEQTWRRHQMETFSVSLVICEGNPPVTSGSPHRGLIMWSFYLNKSLDKQPIRVWFETTYGTYDGTVNTFSNPFP